MSDPITDPPRRRDPYERANQVAALFGPPVVLRTAQDERRQDLADSIRALIHTIETEAHPPVYASMLESHPEARPRLDRS